MTSVVGTPDVADLLQAVIEWIADIRPSLDERNVFLARVAAGALGVVSREFELGPGGAVRARAELSALLDMDTDLGELNDELARRLRTGVLHAGTPGLLDALSVITSDQLAIDQPKYRYDAVALRSGGAGMIK